MRRIKYFIYIAIILSLLLSCEFAGFTVDLGGGESSESSSSYSASIEAGIDSPADGSSLTMASVDISYHASSSEGVAAVELSIDGEVLSSIATPGSDQKIVALQYTWQPTAPGSHTIRVRAQDNAGVWSNFAISTINIEGVEEVQAQAPTATEEQATSTPEPTATTEPTATPDEVTFFDIKHDKNRLYYGSNSCGSHELTISTRVTNPDDVYVVVLFIRFADKESSDFTKWDSGRSMSKKGDDTYSVTLTSNKIPNYNKFEFAVLRYQIVAQDKDGNSIARTEVMEDLNLDFCPNP